MPVDTLQLTEKNFTNAVKILTIHLTSLIYLNSWNSGREITLGQLKTEVKMDLIRIQEKRDRSIHFSNKIFFQEEYVENTWNELKSKEKNNDLYYMVKTTKFIARHLLLTGSADYRLPVKVYYQALYDDVWGYLCQHLT